MSNITQASAQSQDIQSTLRIIQALVQQRVQTAQRDLQGAIDEGRWSQVAGLAGIRESLMGIARNLSIDGKGVMSVADLARLSQGLGSQVSEYDALRDQAVAQERYQEVAAHDGMATGCAMAKKIVDDEIASLTPRPIVRKL